MVRKQQLVIASLATIAVATAAPAHAAGTIAGTTITNTATVDYQVSGVGQTQLTTNSDSFVVDRLINLTVVETNGLTTQVVPGQNAAYVTFTVTNTSNATLDFGLAVAQQTGGSAPHGGTDSFNVTAPTIYLDTNGNGVYDPGTDTAASFLDEVAPDAARTVFVVANIPATQTNGQIAVVRLTATAREGGVVGTQGAVVTQTAGANTAAMDTVFGDPAGPSDAIRNGQHSAVDDFTVVTANLGVTKSSRLISDPINNTTNPKAIPGAVIEYCIRVANTGSAAASNVVVNDNLPGELNFVAGSIFVNGTVTGADCNADGTAGGSFADPVVSGTIASVAAGATRTVVFRTTVK